MSDEIDLESLMELIPKSEPIVVKDYQFLDNSLANGKLRNAIICCREPERIGYDVAVAQITEAREAIIDASCHFNRWKGHQGEIRFRAEYQKLVGDYNQFAAACQEKGIAAEVIDPKSVIPY